LSHCRDSFRNESPAAEVPDDQLVHPLRGIRLHPVAGLRDPLDAQILDPTLGAVDEVTAEVPVALAPDEEDRNLDPGVRLE